MSTPTIFPVSTVVTVDVTSPAPGLQGLNTGNLALFSDEPYNSGFPASGIQYYTSAYTVGIDFGTSSKTYQMATAIFSQNPNILLPGGQLIVVSMKTAAATLTYSGVPASGSWVLTYNANNSAPINWNDTAAQVQAKIQAVPGLEGVTVTGTQAGELLTLQLWNVYGKTPTLPTITSNTLETSGAVAITITVANSVNGESVNDCLNRTMTLVPYFGVLVTETSETIGDTDFNAAAATVQANTLVMGMVGSEDSQNTGSGLFIANTLAGNTQTRCLSYFDTTPNNPLLYVAGYFGRLLSVDYNGSNTRITMNGKQLSGVPVDSVITTGADFTDAKTAGSDVYIDIGTPGDATPFLISNGANLYADQVTGRLWLKNAIQTAYFNALAQTNTMIPQDEDGMNTIKNALKAVMAQAITCGYVEGNGAVWSSPDTFGNITDFYDNISSQGFYIYSTPIPQLTQAQISGRQAPLIQIAYVEKNAVHSGAVLIQVVA